MTIENPEELKNTKKEISYFDLYYTVAIYKNESGEIMEAFDYCKNEEEASHYAAEYAKENNLTLIKLICLNKHVGYMADLKLVRLRDENTKKEAIILI